jgi:hypothetical protein
MHAPAPLLSTQVIAALSSQSFSLDANIKAGNCQRMGNYLYFLYKSFTIIFIFIFYPANTLFLTADFIASFQLQNMTNKNIFIHHVYFWLNNPESENDKKALLKGLEKLSAVNTIRFFHIGEPANTNRDVIDRSYAVSWLLFFDNPEDQESYQTDPIHLAFIDECKHLWKKVQVYDSVSAL